MMLNKGAIGCFLDIAPRATTRRARSAARGVEEAGGADAAEEEEGDAGARVLLINSHLAAHQGRVDDRRADYWRICREVRDDASR